MYEWYDPPGLLRRDADGVAVWTLEGDWLRDVDLRLRHRATAQLDAAAQEAEELLVIELPSKPVDSWGEVSITGMLAALHHQGVQLRLVADEHRHSEILHSFFTSEVARVTTEVFKTLAEAMPQRHNGLVLTFQSSDAPLWIAYSLDFDLMAQDESREAALKSLRWVIRTAARDDRRGGLTLFARTPASLDELHGHLTDHKDDASLTLQRVFLTF
jgi:hypothetical protein